MRFEDREGSGPASGGEGLNRFPGSVAVPVMPVGSGPPSVVLEQNDDDPWAVEVGYGDAGGPLLVVRTVRSTRNLDPRGLPVEDLGSAVVNFQLRASAPQAPGALDRDPARWLVGRSEQNVSTRSEIARTPTSTVSLRIDDADVPGKRVDVAGCSAVELAWGEQRVFCVGVPDVVADLRLRSAAPNDLDASIPHR